LTVAVTPGTNPTSTGLTVAGDLTAIGGPASTPLFDDGTSGDVTAGDLTFSLLATVAAGTPSGPRVVGFTIADAQGRTGSASATVTVQAVQRAISAIQGTGAQSPFAGQLVTTRGIVTARKSNGFFLQTPDADADPDPATSEGIFVFTSSAPPADAAVGNEVAVTGTITEFVPSADPNSPPMTELSLSPSVALLSTGNPLPTPAAMAPDPTLPNELFERFEGMRVVAGLTVVAPTDGFVSEPNASSTTNGIFYAVLTGTPRPFREAGINILDPLPAGSPANVPRFDENPERIRVDSDGQTGVTPVEVSSGASFADVVGVVDFAFRTYTVLPDAGELADQVGAAVPVRLPAVDEFTVAAFNLERFFDTVNDPDIGEPVLTAAAFERRLKKASLAIRNVLRAPDILGVEEVENLSTLQTLAARINADAVAAGQPDPGYVGYLEEGNDVGGIDVGFLVRAPRVIVEQVEQVGLDAMYLNPLTNQLEILNDRPPLVLRARMPGPALAANNRVVVVVNHLRSLLGMEDPVDGIRIRAKRVAQAEFLAELLDSLQGPRASVAAIGDFNAFEVNDGHVDVMGVVDGTPAPPDEVVVYGDDLVQPDFVNLARTIAPAGAYSYVFDGNAQILDHVVVSPPLRARLREFVYARNDADFPEGLRNDDTRPERISDHDVPVAYFRTPRANVSLTAAVSGAAGDAVTYTLGAGNAGPDVAEQVVVTHVLPEAMAFEAVSAPAGWHCVAPPVGSSGTVTCTASELAGAARILVSARVACGARGALVASASSVTSAWDPVAADDSARASFRVGGRAPGAASCAAPVKPVRAPARARLRGARR
jgi:uncharacterized repeat protein (TIGR01451 family)